MSRRTSSVLCTLKKDDNKCKEWIHRMYNVQSIEDVSCKYCTYNIQNRYRVATIAAHKTPVKHHTTHAPSTAFNGGLFGLLILFHYVKIWRFVVCAFFFLESSANNRIWMNVAATVPWFEYSTSRKSIPYTHTHTQIHISISFCSYK